MTEQEWLECAKPEPMLKLVQSTASDRKLRLFGYDCCDKYRGLLNHRSLAALVTAERYADGLSNETELEAALSAASDVLEQPEYHSAGLAVKWLCHKDLECVCGPIATHSADYLAWRQPRHLVKATRRLALNQQTHILRDIFGNPFRPVNPDSTWLTSTVISLAQAIYTDRAFDRMPILGDALEDAGCTNADILNHCRQPGEHVRGCWIVDLVLSKS